MESSIRSHLPPREERMSFGEHAEDTGMGLTTPIRHLGHVDESQGRNRALQQIPPLLVLAVMTEGGLREPGSVPAPPLTRTGR